MNAISRAIASVKAMTRMSWGRTSSWFSMLLGSTTFDYRTSAGDGRGNAAVMACVRFAQRTLPEAPLQVVTRNRDGELKPAPDHALQMLLERPNPYYSGLHLLGAIVADLMLTGNAYAIKVRSGVGRPVQLWWAPASLMEPAWPDDDPTVYISHYEYRVEGDVVMIDPADVVHIRDLMMDPNNIRKGLSPLAALYREIASDNEAANWTGSLLRNGAVPGVVISPSTDAEVSDDDLEGIKSKFMQRFGGDERGAPMVMKGPTSVQVLSFNPEQMNLRELRIVPEERVTAVLGIPAIVAGLGAGLQRSTFANFAEAREAAYESFIIPTQRLLIDQLMMQLVPDFGDTATLRLRFDLSEVRVLQDDQNALHQRAREDLSAGLLTLNQALEMIGADPVEGEAGDVRYIPTSVTVRTLDTLIPEEQPAELEAPTPLRALPAGDDAAAGKGVSPSTLKAAALSDDEIVARFESGLVPLAEDLAGDLLDAFEDLATVALSRYRSSKAAGDAIDGLLTLDDHEPIRRLLRGYVLKGMRQAAEDLAPLTNGPVRIQRNTPAVKQAIADMEARLPGIAATTGEDFGRLIRRMERRPGSVTLAEVRSALTAYIEEAYPSRAEMIARSELTFAHSAGILHVAKRTGIAEHVRVIDGHEDPECSAADGQLWTLDEAGARLSSHPNCTRRFVPVSGAAA